MRHITNPREEGIDSNELPDSWGVHPSAMAYVIMRDEEPTTVYKWQPNNLPGEADADFTDAVHEMCVGMLAVYRLAGVI